MLKKYIAMLVVFFYSTTNITFAVNELYTVKNANINSAKAIVENEFLKSNMFILHDNPVIGMSYMGDNSATVFLEQKADGILYYYESDTDTATNKAILKNFTYNGFSYSQVNDNSAISVYKTETQNYLAALQQNNLSANVQSRQSTTANKTKYTFEDEPPQNTVNNSYSNSYKPSDSTVLRGQVAQLAPGTKFNVYLQSGIDTSNAVVGDEIIAVLIDDLKYNSAIIAPQGSLVYGRLEKARSAGYAMRDARVVLNFYKLVTTDNVMYDISTEEIDFAVSSEEGKISGAAKVVLGLAAIGAVVGLLVAAGGISSSSSSGSHHHHHSSSSSSSSSDSHIGTATAIGAGLGATIGVASAIGKKGSDAEIPAMTQIELTLTKPLNVSVNF